MKKGLTIALALALALAMPVLAIAQQGCPEWGTRGGRSFEAAHNNYKTCLGSYEHHGKGMGMGIHHLLAIGDEINLTDDQQAKLEGMMIEFKLQSIDLKADIEKAQVKLRVLKRDDAAESDVMRAIDDMAGMKAEMHKMQYKHHQQVKAVLTDNQVEQLKQLRKERSMEGRKFKEKRGHGRRG